jgi:quaternary ammonium compound-resistance protein SugE
MGWESDMAVFLGVSLRTIMLVAFVTLTQVAGSALLVKTDGFRAAGWTALCFGIYAASFFAMATMLKEGMPLGLLLPLLAAMVPLLTIAVAILFYGEAASWSRIGLLCLSCLLVGLASRS